MLELEEWLIERGMHFGGCGECDSAWLKCAKCDVEIAGIAGMGMVAQND
jgi:hypothetical protein